MGSQKNTSLTKDTLVSQPVTSENNNKTNTIMYVVVRDGYRVSDKEYSSYDDPEAIAEKEFWTRIENKYSFGAIVDIVPYESKKHRIW